MQRVPDRHLPRFFRCQRNDFRVIGVDNDETKTLLKYLLPDPDTAFQAEYMVKPGSRTHAGFVTLGGRMHFLKRYNCRNWQYRVRNVFRRSRALRTWKTTWILWFNNVPVPRPELFLEERQGRLLGRSYVLMESLHNSERLIEVFDAADQKRRLKLLEVVALTLGTMHAAGGVHGDLKWSNILVESADDTGLHLVDLDGARMLKRYRRKDALKDVHRFVRDLAPRDDKGEYVPLFLQLWEKSLAEALQKRSSR